MMLENKSNVVAVQSNKKKKTRNNTTAKLENRIEKARQFLVSMDQFPAFKKSEETTLKEIIDLFNNCEELTNKYILTVAAKQNAVALRAKRYSKDADGLNKCLTKINGYLKNKKGVPQGTIDLVAALVRITRNSGKSKARKEEEARLAADPQAEEILRKFTKHGGTYGNRLATLGYINKLLQNLGPIYTPINKNIKLARLGKLHQELVVLNKKAKATKDVYRLNLKNTSICSKKLMMLCSKTRKLLLTELEDDDPRAGIIKEFDFV